MADFNYIVDRFGDIQILRYQVEGFEELPLEQKLYIYYLSQAALCGRDIVFDQNYTHNLIIRKVLEAIYNNYTDKKEDSDFILFVEYLKKVWLGNGIHHPYSVDKFVAKFSQDFFVKQIKKLPQGQIPLNSAQSIEQFIEWISPILFDPSIDAKGVCLDPDVDVIKASANNFYKDVTQQEVEDFYAAKIINNQDNPSWGLNSQLIKEDGVIVEKIWTTSGMYGHTIQQIVEYLRKAMMYANDNQKLIISLLISYYEHGDLTMFDTYSIAWLQDVESHVDFVNGFIETYGDPLGIKGSWEAFVNFKNIEASKRTTLISENAQWFEDQSPIDYRFKKELVTGVSAKVVTMAILGGDTYPVSFIGVNLPNSKWIRAQYGSKSVTLENITKAYDEASKGNGFSDEFVALQSDRDLIKKFGYQTSNLHTDLHECLGHGSGKILPGVSEEALKTYGATIEEARADLFALYYIADPKLLELGLIDDENSFKAEYYSYILNGAITQIVRVEAGKNLEESHMRNRALISRWTIEHADPTILEIKKENDKTFLYIYDYQKLRHLFGELLCEIQRIRSEGDFEAAKYLVEKYAVKVDSVLHGEILARYKKLNIAAYRGFVNPKYEVIYDENKKPIDVSIDYSEGYADQMLRYSRDFSTL